MTNWYCQWVVSRNFKSSMHIFGLQLLSSKSVPHRELNHPISIILLTKFIHIRLFIFCHYQKRFTCDPPLGFIFRSVQLAHNTKKLWENENSIEYRISFHPKKFFGVNRTPKILVNVATSFLKWPNDIANELFRGTLILRCSFLFCSCYQANLYLIENWTTPSQ